MMAGLQRHDGQGVEHSNVEVIPMIAGIAALLPAAKKLLEQGGQQGGQQEQQGPPGLNLIKQGLGGILG